MKIIVSYKQLSTSDVDESENFMALALFSWIAALRSALVRARLAGLPLLSTFGILEFVGTEFLFLSTLPNSSSEFGSEFSWTEKTHYRPPAELLKHQKKRKLTQILSNRVLIKIRVLVSTEFWVWSWFQILIGSLFIILDNNGLGCKRKWEETGHWNPRPSSFSQQET